MAQRRINFGKKYWYLFFLILLVLMIVGCTYFYYYYSPWIVVNQRISNQDSTFGWNLSDCDALGSPLPIKTKAQFIALDHTLYFQYFFGSYCNTHYSNYNLSYHQFGNEINITGIFFDNIVAECICQFEICGYIKGLIPGVYIINVFHQSSSRINLVDTGIIEI
jgi:hypothetical protein